MPTHIRNPVFERIALRLKTAWDWTIAKLVIFGLDVAQKLPPEKSTNFAEKVGRALAPILPRSKLARRNMTLAFPEKSAKEIDAMLKGMWGNVARTVAEYVFLDQLFDYDLRNEKVGRVEFTGDDLFVGIREAGKPVIMFTAHTGNWELLPVGAATHHLPVTALFRQPNNRFLAERLLKARRTSTGDLVPSGVGAAWALADVLEQGRTVGLLADQAFTRGPHLQFLGREASANPIAAKLARQYDADIYPARCIRLPGGRFRIELEPKLELPRDGNGNLDIVGTTRAINHVIERWIREYPEQWLWLHDRWKIKATERGKWQK